MPYLIGYVAALVSFGAIDALWLRLMGPVLYRPTLGDILVTEVRVGPAIAFYLVYPIGVLVLAVLPALRSNSLAAAVGSGIILAAIAAIYWHALSLLLNGFRIHAHELSPNSEPIENNHCVRAEILSFKSVKAGTCRGPLSTLAGAR